MNYLNAFSNNNNKNITTNSSTTNGTDSENYGHFPGAILHCFIDGEEEGKIQ
jgi:hypothetical protein